MVIVAYEQVYLHRPIGKMSDLLDMPGPLLLMTWTFTLCLFSVAGIPPLIGFYAKLLVLQASLLEGSSLLYLVAVACSVVSACFYMRMMKIMLFQVASPDRDTCPTHTQIPPLYCYTISVLSVFMCLFILDSSLFINSTELAALTWYNH